MYCMHSYETVRDSLDYTGQGKVRVASCVLQKLTLYHNIYLQLFSTLKIAFKLHDLSYCTAPLDCLQPI